jgi:hypothetical protein
MKPVYVHCDSKKCKHVSNGYCIGEEIHMERRVYLSLLTEKEVIISCCHEREEKSGKKKEREKKEAVKR